LATSATAVARVQAEQLVLTTPRMRLVADEMVPDSIGTFLESRRHKVFRVREHLKEGTSDDGVARFANQVDAIVITWNVRHFRQLLDRKRSAPFPKAGMISFTCEEADGRGRIRDLIEVIEAEFAHLQTRPDKRLFADIGVNFLRIWR
jgi:hypothetical protein